MLVMTTIIGVWLLIRAIRLQADSCTLSKSFSSQKLQMIIGMKVPSALELSIASLCPPVLKLS